MLYNKEGPSDLMLDFNDWSDKEKTLKKLYSTKNINISNIPEMSLDGFTWKYKNNNLEVEIIGSKEYLEKTYEKLNSKDFEKNLFDENFGAVPHELIEAELTAIIMLRKFELIPEKFLNQFKNELVYIERIFSKNNNKPFTPEEIFRNEKIYDHVGGHVHDIIERSTPGYSQWIDYIYSKITS